MKMDIFIQFIINTILIQVFAMIIVALILYWNNKKLGNTSFLKGKILKLKFGRVFTFASITLLFLSMFLHWGFFVFIGLFEGDKPGLNINNGFVGFFGIIMSIVLLTILFLVSVPNIVLFFQFLKHELNRIIVLDETDRVIRIYHIDNETIIRNKEVQKITFCEKKIFARGDEKLDYVKINYNNNSQLVVTNLLTRLNRIEFIFKGVNREYTRKIFNKITCG